MVRTLSSGLPDGRPSDILVVAPFHPFPPGDGSSTRVSQYIRYLRGKGFTVDLAVLSPDPSAEKDRECLDAAREHCRRILVVRHPFQVSPARKFLYRLYGRIVGFRLGDWFHCPPEFAWELRRNFGGAAYRAAIFPNLHLARAARLLRPPTIRILDAHDVWYDRFVSFAAFGREAELLNFSDPRREARLAGIFDVVMAITDRDAGIFRRIGVTRPIISVPFSVDPAILGAGEAGEEGSPEPVRPPRLLFVGTGGSSNLDGLRYFRTRVFPSIHRQVPTCRLRVVGGAAHHMDPGPGLELVGWSDRLEDEYREAAAVVVPLRMGSGLKSKVVDALGHGKALLTTTVGAQGIPLQSGRDSIVSDDPAVLAREGVRILTDDLARRELEAGARVLARRLFHPDAAYRPLLEIIEGRDLRAPRAAGAPVAAAAR